MGTLPHNVQAGVCHGRGSLGSGGGVFITYGAGGGAQAGRARLGPLPAPIYALEADLVRKRPAEVREVVVRFHPKAP